MQMQDRAEEATVPSGDAAPIEVVRSEERLNVTTRRAVAERWRVAKRVVTETVTRVVEVRREELVLEPVDLSAVERLELSLGLPGAGSALEVGEDIELILHREEVVVETRVVPYERVVVRRVPVIVEQTVEETLRRERVDIEVESRG